MHFTYSRWDGTQGAEAPDPEALMDALADDVLESGEVDEAVARLTWREAEAGDTANPARSLVGEFVRERERLRHAHRQDTDGTRTDPVTSTAEPAWEPVPDALRGQEAVGLELRAREVPGNGSGPPRDAGTTGEGSSRASSGVAYAPPVDPRYGSDAEESGDSRIDEARSRSGGQSGREALDPLLGQDTTSQTAGRDYRGSVAGTNVSERRLPHLGHGARITPQGAEAIPAALVRAGYLRLVDQRYRLTARGVRRIGQKALKDIFQGIQSRTPGDHPIRRGVGNSTVADGHRKYEAEDDFQLDLNRTLLNAVSRSGPSTPVDLSVDDFEVLRTDRLTQASTVLLVDVSPSMSLRGCLAAGRRVALALHTLIESRFPRDLLYLVAFSGYARVVRTDAFQELRGGAREYGTNMQHGLTLARKLLSRHRGSRQIILITDGEPTAHLEDDRALFAYPPTARTRRETLREARRCTRDDIVINTFMLAPSEELGAFIDDLTRLNRGRAFFTTPDRLGRYVVTDYVRHRVGA